ncbi:FecCD family ABC transporter permease [Vibrio salinus]|uniref:FecCD family ABC transporter permease n=1 Tax=Vibrio salinus TaxID=2899784 RepID=UPI001E36C717|nr:iron ABC transporter permease [Vibrio salinus]MCE0493096.1 iron ABC transporter permease [Vibrio salinus]
MINPAKTVSTGYHYHSKKRAIRLAALVFLTGLLMTANLFSGSRTIDASTTLSAIFQFDANNSQHLLVHYLRLPRIFLGLITGLSLGIAGTFIQALTRNPLADPGILGIHAGATTAIVIAIALLGIHNTGQYLWFGMIGAALSGGLVYTLTHNKNSASFNPIKFVLSGAAISAVLLAIAHIIIINSENAVFDQFRHWTVGSLQGRGFNVLIPCTIGLITFILPSLFIGRTLNVLSLGPESARSMGINLKIITVTVAFIIIAISGLTTAAIGPVSFIGLAAPHIARTIAGPDYRWIIPYSAIIGALMLICADLLGKWVGYPGEVSAGIMASLLGGPFFLFLIRKWRISQL